MTRHASCNDLIGKADREHFVALYLNGRHRITHAHIVSRGTTRNALVHPREVFKGAILANASAVIVAHNHPTGDVTPSSDDDRTVTKRIIRSWAADRHSRCSIHFHRWADGAVLQLQEISMSRAVSAATEDVPPVHRLAQEGSLSMRDQGLMTRHRRSLFERPGFRHAYPARR